MKKLHFAVCIGLVLTSMYGFSSDKNNNRILNKQDKAFFCIALLLTPFSFESVVTVPLQQQFFDISESPVEKFMKQNHNEQTAIESRSSLKQAAQQKYKKPVVKSINHR